MAAFVLDGKFLTEVQNRQRKGLTAAGNQYLKLMAETLSNSPARHGRKYVVTKGGRIHVASAPGEPPALLTGDLRRRRASRLGTDNGTQDLRMEFGSSVPYARRLELGGGAIEPRPAWGVTMERSFPVLMQVFTETFRRG